MNTRSQQVHFFDLDMYLCYRMTYPTHPPKQILYKSYNAIKNVTPSVIISWGFLKKKGIQPKWIVLISLSRVQGCSGRGETPARCSCSACLGPRGSPLHPPSCYLPLKMSELTNMLQLDMGGGCKTLACLL